MSNRSNSDIGKLSLVGDQLVIDHNKLDVLRSQLETIHRLFNISIEQGMANFT
jgi:hypothetical protein